MRKSICCSFSYVIFGVHNAIIEQVLLPITVYYFLHIKIKFEQARTPKQALFSSIASVCNSTLLTPFCNTMTTECFGPRLCAATASLHFCSHEGKGSTCIAGQQRLHLLWR